MFLPPLAGRLVPVIWTSAAGVEGRRIALWLAAGLGLIAATSAAAVGMGGLGVAIVLLPVAMLGYSVAMTAAATADDRRESAAIEQANEELRRFVLGETSVLIGMAREQQQAIQAGYEGADRAALEEALADVRFAGEGQSAYEPAAPLAPYTDSWQPTQLHDHSPAWPLRRG